MNMKIIKYPDSTAKSAKGECPKCGAVFIAAAREFRKTNWLEKHIYYSRFIARCPFCNKKCEVDTDYLMRDEVDPYDMDGHVDL